MRSIKTANVAGRFYPSNQQELLSLLNNYLANKECSNENIAKEIRGIIVPHAGYIFSGEVAGTAYSYLQKLAPHFPQVAVLAPSHYFYLENIAILNNSQYETPLGTITINQELVQSLINKQLAKAIPEVFEKEHALEVQIPFIQTCAPKSQLIPIIIGQTSCEHVEKLIAELMRQNIFVIISTDLSHFLPYEEAQKVDHETIEYILECAFEKISGNRACGQSPLSGLLKWLKQNNGKIYLLDSRNSGDTAGDRTRVVGYASFAFTLPQKLLP